MAQANHVPTAIRALNTGAITSPLSLLHVEPAFTTDRSRSNATSVQTLASDATGAEFAAGGLA